MGTQLFKDMTNLEYKLQELREGILDNIQELFDKYAYKDSLGDTSIQSRDMSDKSLYLLGDFEPEWNDDLEDTIIFPCGIVEFWDNMGEIDVRTLEKGSIHINELELDDLLRCYDYLSYLVDEEEQDETEE